MTSSCLALLLVTWGGLINVQDLPWRDGETSAFVADFDMDGRGEVGVLFENRLEVFEVYRDGPTQRIALPEGTSLVDISDVDGDGTADLIAIAGDDILRIPISAAGTAGPPVRCFTRQNQYSAYSGHPIPGVLVVVRKKVPLIALPCTDALELRNLDGSLVDSYPIGLDAPRRLALGEPFNVWTNQHAQVGGDEALEFRVNSITTFKPMLPDDALPLDIADPSGRLGTTRQQREAADLGPEHWPWFQVNTSSDVQLRALYAHAGYPGDYTVIRIRRIGEARAGQGEGADNTGPVRRYPGQLVLHPEGQADFNGDGYQDLLLWKSVTLSPTVDALARAVTRGSWRVRMIAHTFAPEKSRFEARPMGTIEMTLPLGWYMASGAMNPFRAVFLHDIDGDGRTDIGCLIDDHTVAIWRATADGFEKEPEFQYPFKEAVEEVVFETDLEGEGRTTVALRSKNQLYLLRPNTNYTP